MVIPLYGQQPHVGMKREDFDALRQEQAGDTTQARKMTGKPFTLFGITGCTHTIVCDKENNVVVFSWTFEPADTTRDYYTEIMDNIKKEYGTPGIIRESDVMHPSDSTIVVKDGKKVVVWVTPKKEMKLIAVSNRQFMYIEHLMSKDGPWLLPRK